MLHCENIESNFITRYHYVITKCYTVRLQNDTSLHNITVSLQSVTLWDYRITLHYKVPLCHYKVLNCEITEPHFITQYHFVITKCYTVRLQNNTSLHDINVITNCYTVRTQNHILLHGFTVSLQSVTLWDYRITLHYTISLCHYKVLHCENTELHFITWYHCVIIKGYTVRLQNHTS